MPLIEPDNSASTKPVDWRSCIKNPLRVISNSDMPDTTDPYRIPAGPELDLRIHKEIFHQSDTSDVPPYSTDESFGKKVLRQMRSDRRRSFKTGETNIRNETWYFARYGTDPSTSTEVLSQSMTLSICRLALVISSHD